MSKSQRRPQSDKAEKIGPADGREGDNEERRSGRRRWRAGLPGGGVAVQGAWHSERGRAAASSIAPPGDIAQTGEQKIEGTSGSPAEDGGGDADDNGATNVAEEDGRSGGGSKDADDNGTVLEEARLAACGIVEGSGSEDRVVQLASHGGMSGIESLIVGGTVGRCVACTLIQKSASARMTCGRCRQTIVLVTALAAWAARQAGALATCAASIDASWK